MSAAQRVEVRVGNRNLSLSNLDKVLWPRDGYTKGDLINYYQSVAPYAVPHLEGRPLTLQRYPNGIDGETFFEKQMPRGIPDWIERVTVPTPGGSRSHVTFMLCNDAASLVYVANLAAIVLHVWTSRVEDLDEPDFVIFDLDPGETCTLKTLATVALGFRSLLGDIGLKPLVKTTGGYGVHVVLPLAPGYSYDTAKAFAEVVARRAAIDARLAGDAAAHDRQASDRRRLSRFRPGRPRQDHRRTVFGTGARRSAGLHAAALGRGRSPGAPPDRGRPGRRVRQAYDANDP